MKPFTVIGLDQSEWCYRIFLHVMAYDAQQAVKQAEGVLNLESPSGSSQEKRLFLGAAAFPGHLALGGNHIPNQNGLTGLSGDDRSARYKNEKRCMKFADFTVISLDPATREVAVKTLNHATAANAERNPSFDFFLLGDVLAGRHHPAYLYQPYARPLGRPSTRDERVKGMCAYSSIYKNYLGNNLLMTEPVAI